MDETAAQPISEQAVPQSASSPLKMRAAWARRVDVWLAALVGALAFALYLHTLAPGVLGGDSGEFQFTAWLAGFAHPTGYPLYLILGSLWTHLLPLHSPAWRMNAFSALWAGLTVALVYLLAQRTLLITAPEAPTWIQRVLGLLAALTFAVTPTFWSQAVIAEVYTLNTAFLAAVLLGLTIWAGRRNTGGLPGRQALMWSAALYGLSLAHHRTMILLAPAFAIFLWYDRHPRVSWHERFESVARALPLMLIPLLLYLYIPLRAPQAPYAHVVISPTQTLDLYEGSLQGFITYITGESFGDEFRSASGALAHLPGALDMLVNEMTWPGVALGACGAFWLGRRSRRLLALSGLSFLSLLAFNLFYGIGDIFVYYIPLYLIWTLWSALGVLGLGELARMGLVYRRAVRQAHLMRPGRGGARLIGRAVPPAPPIIAQNINLPVTIVALVLMLVLPVAIFTANYARVDQSGNNQMAIGWQGVLAQPIPQNAILVSNDRDEMTALMYFQYVEGKRPDITGLFPLIGPVDEWGDVGQVLDNALRSGRPVWLVKPMPGLEVKFQLEAAGSLVKVDGPAVTKAPDHARPAAFGDAAVGDAMRLSGYDLRPASLTPGARVNISLYWQPQQALGDDYTTFVHILNADGIMVAQDDHQPGGNYYPTHLWRAGELLKDTHAFTLPTDLGRAPYSIVVGLYRQIPALEHLGKPEQIGVVGLLRPADTIPADLSNKLALTFDDQIGLNGYKLAVQDNSLKLTLYWQALSTPQIDYTAFVHLLDANGRIVTQQDQQPGGTEAPTSTWPRGYTLADDVTIAIPRNLPAGKYRLVAGLYDAATMARLPITDDRGRPSGDTAELAQINWPPSGS
jgi:hypothetical protein